MARAVLALCLVATVQGKTFRFTAIGDWGMGGIYAGHHAEVTSAMSLHHVAEEFDTQFVINVGDQLYMPEVNLGMQQSFYSTWARKGANKGGVWFCTRGNHDNHRPQMEHTRVNPNWWFPSEHYTRLVETGLGFNVQVWGLDSNAGPPSWLERSLSSSTARWKFFTTHFPFANAGRHKRVQPPVHYANVAKRYGVQAVFSGHDHIVQICVHQGVLFITTGATSRGAMMARPVDGDKSQFVYTLGTKSSIGMHGITTFELTKNVIWGSTHGHFAMVHEFTSVWDWPRAYARYKSHSMRTRLSGGHTPGADSRFPPPSVILEYLRKEAEEAGEAGNISSTSQATPSTPETSAPSRLVDTSTEHEKEQFDKEKKQMEEAAKEADQKMIESRPVPVPTPPEGLRGATYVVASECTHCVGPSMEYPMTVWIQGVPTDEKHKLFLAYSKAACSSNDLQQAVGVGDKTVRVLTEAIQRFTPKGDIIEAKSIYVCVSQDGGDTYAAIPQADSRILAFSLYPKPAARTGDEGSAVVKNYSYNSPSSVELRISSPASGSSSSNAVLWVVVVLLLFALPVAWVMGRSQGRSDLSSG